MAAIRPGVLAAAKFAERFEVISGVDYKWVVGLAKEQYATAVKTFDDLDTKAAYILAYLGGGTGLFSIGALAAITTDKFDWVVAACSLAPFLAAVVALVFAGLARQVADIYYPQVSYAALCAAELDESGEAGFIGQWADVTERTRASLDRKAERLMWATWATIAAIGLLTLPAAARVWRGPPKPNDPPAAVLKIDPATGPVAVPAK